MGVGQWFGATESEGDRIRSCPSGPDLEDTLWAHLTRVQSCESERTHTVLL